ncbi:cation acetate symporter [Streptomyces sp. DH37]|uniref:solute symporter family protein n=1 Tax=Streptomyces sp. DH37 TaxID=3040122 RepID=UPI002442DB5C|nr:cation acetate symporter [Streptomyces sp. DH37]MDG9703456.1 cation acetate symporter [Streptomyces sp. DH37]
MTRRAGRGRHGPPEEFHTGGRLFSPMANGFALAGGHLPAAALLGAAGTIALRGDGGLPFCAGLLAAWPLALLLAESVRNCGRLTLADVVAVRMRERPVRIAVGVSSVTVSLLCLVAQTAGAGGAVALLLGGGPTVRACAVLGVGVLVAVHVSCGGMRATTWLQTAAAGLLLACAAVLAVLVLLRHGGDPAALAAAAAERGGSGSGSGSGSGLLAPERGHGWTARLDLVSLALALVLGTAGMPHVLARFLTVPTARAARRSALWATGLTGGLCLTAVVLGLGATALVGPEAVRAADASGNAAVPLLALELGGGAGSAGGAVLFAVVAAVALTTALAVAAGLTLASSASVVHDLRASPGRRRRRPPRGGTAAARCAAVAVGAVATALALAVREANAALLVGLALAVAASANVPVLLYALFRRRFTARGALWSVYGGLVSAVALAALSPAVSGGPGALLPQWDFAVFPLHNPALVSVPLGFLAGRLGTLLSPEPADGAGYAETEVRALTGAGAV